MRQTLTNNFWSLRKIMNCAFRLRNIKTLRVDEYGQFQICITVPLR